MPHEPCPRCGSSVEHTVEYPLTKHISTMVCKRCAYTWPAYEDVLLERKGVDNAGCKEGTVRIANHV